VASKGKAKSSAKTSMASRFMCPFPECASSFTRHHNLNIHLMYKHAHQNPRQLFPEVFAKERTKYRDKRVLNFLCPVVECGKAYDDRELFFAHFNQMHANEDQSKLSLALAGEDQRHAMGGVTPTQAPNQVQQPQVQVLNGNPASPATSVPQSLRIMPQTYQAASPSLAMPQAYPFQWPFLAQSTQPASKSFHHRSESSTLEEALEHDDEGDDRKVSDSHLLLSLATPQQTITNSQYSHSHFTPAHADIPAQFQYQAAFFTPQRTPVHYPNFALHPYTSPQSQSHMVVQPNPFLQTVPFSMATPFAGASMPVGDSAPFSGDPKMTLQYLLS